MYLAACMKLILKFLRILGWTLLTLVSLIVLFVLVSVKRLDRTPVQQRPAYADMMQRLDSLQQHYRRPASTGGFAVGFAKVNLTPPFVTATAGYGNRRGKPYSEVHDSIYVRALVVQQGERRVAIVSADLLIIPPTVTEQLQKILPEIGFDLRHNTYLSAIHSHNSIGNWSPGVAQLLYGTYDERVVALIASSIREAIVRATQNILPATLQAAEIPIGRSVNNRLLDEGQVDSLLRTVAFYRADSSRVILTSYAAHATCLFSRDLALSRDYPGQLVDALEQQGYAMGMFVAGAMGSHGCNPPEMGRTCIDWMANTIVHKMDQEKYRWRTVTDSSLAMISIPLSLPDPQVKITQDWCVRPWLFRAAFGAYPASLTALRLGDIIMLGTPCDFSGELTGSLDSLAQTRGLHTMVTSFNGGYIGYITRDDRFELDHYETRLMSWYGAGNGAYLSEAMAKMIVVLSQ